MSKNDSVPRLANVYDLEQQRISRDRTVSNNSAPAVVLEFPQAPEEALLSIFRRFRVVKPFDPSTLEPSSSSLLQFKRTTFTEAEVIPLSMEDPDPPDSAA